MQFAVDELRRNPNLTYVELKELASARGLLLPPILFGRAKLHLGMPTAPTLKRAAPSPVERAAGAGEETNVAPEPTVLLPRPERRTEPDATRPQPAPKKQLPPPVEEELASPAGADQRATPAKDMVAPSRQGSGVFDFAVRMLRDEPNLEYGDLRLRAEANGFKLPPILYGRAKAYLGLVPVKPRGERAAKQPKRSGPLQLRQVESIAEVQRDLVKRTTGLGSIEAMADQLRQLVREREELREAATERDALRKALQDIAALLADLYRELDQN